MIYAIMLVISHLKLQQRPMLPSEVEVYDPARHHSRGGDLMDASSTKK